jgi:predicted TIM-barrel fold metal-dependent hydrolase
MRIIDAHVHLYPAEVDRAPAEWAAAQGERHWSALCTRRRQDGRPVQVLPTVDQLLATMDLAGVERAVLLGWYWENWDTCQWQNRFYANCVRDHPDRLTACATLHPSAGEVALAAELRRIRDDGLVGIGELSPHAQAHGVDDPVFCSAMAMAGEFGLPVNLHVTDPQSRPYPGRIETPGDDFVKLAQAFPATTFILAHWGGMLPLHDVRFAALKNVYYDSAASPLMYRAEAWPRALAAMGADRVLFGSDFPLNLYPKLDDVPGLVRFVGEAITSGATADVLAGNAARLFKL